MAASSTEIANMAISHLGVGKEISALDTERSEEAAACRRFFDIARDTVLRDLNWPFATKTAALGLVEENPNDEWSYSYRYPSDCLNIRRIQSGLRNDNRQSRVSYRIVRDDTGLLVYTDIDDAVAEYTIQEDDVSRYPADFTMALSLKIAYLIAPRLSRGDPFKIKQDLQREYLVTLSMAKAAAVNEEQPDQEPDSEFIRIRE